jgi:hypothetical protein
VLVDKAAYQPGAGDAIDMHPLSRDPDASLQIFYSGL